MHHDAGRPWRSTSSRSNGPDMRRRHPRMGAAVCRRRPVRVLPQHQPEQTLHRPGSSATRGLAVVSDPAFADADVVVDNFLPGLLARYGLDKGAELSLNSRLMWCTISRIRPALMRGPATISSCRRSRVDGHHRPGRRPPMKSGVALADVITGKDAAVAILAALAGRDAGRPIERQLDLSLAHSAIAALVNVAQNTARQRSDARRWGNAHPNLVPVSVLRGAPTGPRDRRRLGRPVGRRGDGPGARRSRRRPVLATNAGRVAPA